MNTNGTNPVELEAIAKLGYSVAELLMAIMTQDTEMQEKQLKMIPILFDEARKIGNQSPDYEEMLKDTQDFIQIALKAQADGGNTNDMLKLLLEKAGMTREEVMRFRDHPAYIDPNTLKN